MNDAGCGKTITPENHYLENWNDDPDFQPSSEYEEMGTTSGGDSRISYSVEGEKLIKKCFTKFITNPAVLVRRKEMSRILCYFKELEPLINKYSRKNIMTKVRAEKRQHFYDILNATNSLFPNRSFFIFMVFIFYRFERSFFKGRMFHCHNISESAKLYSVFPHCCLPSYKRLRP